MITKTIAFKTDDGELFENLDEAKGHEIEIVLAAGGATTEQNAEIARLIEKNHEKLMDIFTTKPTSRPRARRVNKKPKENTEPKAKA